jgi:hypothetical protein
MNRPEVLELVSRSKDYGVALLPDLSTAVQCHAHKYHLVFLNLLAGILLVRHGLWLG